jgi:hypothetical protein
MTAIQAFLISVVALGLGSCTSEAYARRYDQARVSLDSTYPPEYRVVEGERTVFEMSRFRGMPLPDAFGGSRLLIELDSNLVRAGGLIVVPSSATRAHLLLVRAPSHDTTSEVAGTLRIRDVTSRAVTAEVDLRAAGWQYAGRTQFERTAPSCFGKAPWFARLKGSAGCN